MQALEREEASMSDEPLTPSAGSDEAGTVGEDEERQKTDEEILLEEIAEQKELIDTRPRDNCEEIKRMVSHQRRLGQMEFKHQMMVERKRLASELLKFQELYGVIYSEPCPICLEDIHINASEDLIEMFPCCGGFVCKPCVRDMRESELGLDKCPLCREFLDKTAAKISAQVMTLAKRGVSLAQSNVGGCMMNGIGGFEKRAKTGLEWLNKAAAQNNPSALFHLSMYYRDGFKSLVSKSQEKSNELLVKSANLGYVRANSVLAKFKYAGMDGFEEDKEETYFRASVALALDGENEKAANLLGALHYFEDVLEPSSYLAYYYANIAARDDPTGVASQLYSRSLLQLADHLHHGNIMNNGSNVMPAVVFWLRKSCAMGCEEAREMVKSWETVGQGCCANCSKKAETGEKYKQCSKCRAQWYCSKGCQVKAWRDGHKQDCKRATILEFEDYLHVE